MISIVIPTRNEEKWLEQTLSRLKLTIPHEIIVSDGKSTDKTVEIARRYTNKVAVFESPGRQTIAAGRNAGAKLAEGEYIAFMDADCYLENPDRDFSIALETFKQNPKLMAQAAWIKVFPEQATFLDKVIWFFMNVSNMLLNLIGVGVAPGELQIMKKEHFNLVGGFKENLVATEDYDMFNRLSKFGVTRLNPKLVVYHSGRHAHKLGWPKLLSLWFLNTFFYVVRNKSYSKEWEDIR